MSAKAAGRPIVLYFSKRINSKLVGPDCSTSAATLQEYFEARKFLERKHPLIMGKLDKLLISGDGSNG